RMKWTKLGRIFDPTDFALPNGCEEFAQSPQALVFDDCVRIYFSSRQRDPRNGKYLSHICFADFDKTFQRVLRVSDAPVIPLGKLGCFDEHGIFPMNVLRHEGKIFGYTSGWTRRVSVSVDTGIGLAFSDDDGLTFNKTGDGPVLTASLHEPCLVGDPFVQVHEGVFHMWYIFGTGWKRFAEDQPPDRIYKIGHATSHDGAAWTKDEGVQIIADRLHADESQALPTVVRIGSRFHMLFCYRESSDFRTSAGRGYRLGYAWSDDLQVWTRDDADVGIDVSAGEWDADMLCYPHLFQCDGKVYLLYNGNEFGRRGFGIAVLE
ncbi:MAG: hypothetical protein ABIO38_07640, partial [Luteimonas sp.]